MLTMTKNDYLEFIKAEADKMWKTIFSIPEGAKNPNFEKLRSAAWKTYNDTVDSVEVMEFEINSNNEEFKSWINALCSNEEVRKGCKLYRGHSNNNYKMIKELDLKYVYDGGYSSAYYNDDLKTTFSYCEGDVCFTVYETIEAYEEGKTSFINWYKENC